ncbi:MAG: autotransporter domain-containing protein [Parvibaculum sp.]|uniref:autotransporter domain-containing protein n=1 Tax=Parvibaculum sp. TaxID=2024848 RepID=UPI0025D62B23|nr:autotransporter domain-containing protein [Parvibaculum sp.]MCE9649731.1 autotransporter domain-containing protein [Parvibaculum sp.]
MSEVAGRALSRAELRFFTGIETGMNEGRRRGYRAKLRLLGSTALTGLALWSAPALADTYATTGDYPDDVTLSSPTTLTANTGVTATVTGTVSGAQPLTVSGTGIVVFDNPLNNWTGLTTITADATLRGTTDTIAGSALVVDAYGKMDFVQSTSGTFSREISGGGTVWVSGLDEDEAVTFSGAVTLSTGLMAGVDGHIDIAETGSITVTGTASTVLLKYEGSSLNNAGILTQNGVSAAVNAQVGATLENSGTITAQKEAVWFAQGGGEINNLAGGQIVSATASAIVVDGSGTTVNNSGSITSADVAIRLAEAGTITNHDGGTINSDNYSSAIYGTGTTGTTTVTNEEGGSITSGGALIELSSDASIENSGTMEGIDGIWLYGGGTVTNREGGTIKATASDAYSAVWSGYATEDLTVENHGEISGGAYTIASDGGGKVIIENYGSIAAGDGWAVYLSSANDSMTLHDGSTLTGDVAMDFGDDEVALLAGSTVTGDVYGGEGDDAFTLMAGATVNGNLIGGADNDTLTLGGDSDDDGGSIDSDAIREFETLVKAGTGDWTLTGTSTLADTAIKAGTGTAAGKLIFDGTSTLTTSIDVNGATIRAASAGAFGTGTIHAIDPTIEFGATGTYTNDISLEVAAPATGDPTTLSADSGVTATLSGAITRGGGDTVQPLNIGGAGTIVLTNTGNSWTGITTIGSGATLQGTLDTISGSSFVSNGTLAFAQAASGTFAKNVSGTGKVAVSGLTSGNAFTFTGALTNAGGVTSADGANIVVGNTGSIAATSGTAIKFTGSFDNTLSNYGALSTTGATAVALGAGNDTFNNYAGSVTGIVDAEGGADTLNIDRGAATGYTLTGSKWLNFETTNIRSGTVTLAGDYASATAFNIASGAAFVGSGTVTTASLHNEGTLVVGPLSTTGSLTVDGDFVNGASATYVVKFDSAASDLLDITGAATLAGTVEVNGLNSISKATYTILSAGDGVSGEFDSLVTNLSPFVRATLDYRAHDVLLAIDPVADSAGGSAVAEALFKSTGAGPELTQVMNDIANMSDEDAGKALEQLTPEQSDAPTNGTTQTVQTFQQQTGQHIASLQSAVAASRGGSRLALGGRTDGDLTTSLVAGSLSSATRGGLWGRAFGLGGSLDASAGATNGLSYKGGGFDGGFDAFIAEDLLVGLSAGYARVLNDPDRVGASSELKSYSLGIYAATMMGAFDLTGQFGYTMNEYRTSRHIVILPATNLLAAADFNGATVSATAEAGYTLTSGNLALRPAASLGWMRLTTDGYSETGAPGLNLTQASRSDTLVRSTLGVSAALKGGSVVPSLGLRWGHDIKQADGALSYAFAGLANSSFSIDRNTPARDALLVDAGLETKLGKAVDLSLTGSADLRNNAQGYGLSVKLRYNW